MIELGARASIVSDPKVLRWAVPAIAAMLTIQVSLGTVFRMEINPAHFLAPVVGLAVLFSLNDRLATAFIVSGLCGLGSVFAAHIISPDILHGNIAELLIWTMFAPSFLFLGRLVPLRAAVRWLGIFSVVFLVTATLPLLVTGEPVRGVYPFGTPGRDPGTSYMNVHILGLPVFASYGVNSIAPLFCMQAALLCGAIFSCSNSLRILFSVGLACAIFLVIGSESRASQGALILLALFFGGYCFWRRQGPWLAYTLIASAVVLAGAAVSIRVDEVTRMAHLVQGSAYLMKSKQTHNERTAEPAHDLSALTTGRTDLWTVAAREFAASPLIGNGFSGFGRFEPIGKHLGANTTPHLYYLNILWKGGLLFAVPFAYFIFLAFKAAWEHRRAYPEWAFSAAAVVAMFAVALTWDILMIPGAGVLTWFLLGSMGGENDEIA
ncbi:O-antigen ligase family protein [Chelativorans sp.]|uniref:O-antigen ligase family protein n=1 Tax=Chelativorans sp. TaxID=2203393 RepID=UPI002810FD2C|nr:O-antigen ligase family protein [Chelativorans sp.]